MSNWIDTALANVSVSWDERRSVKAKISRRYKIDADGEPLEKADYDEVMRACETALDSIGVHVLLQKSDDADAGEAEEGWGEEVMYPKVDETWAPTHKITFTPQGGEPQASIFVMFVEENMAAYDRDEWRAEESGAWYIDRSQNAPNGPGWYCEGRVTPGGQNGDVEIEELDPKPREHCECGQALEDGRCVKFLDTETPVTIRYVPEWQRSSHVKAGYGGVAAVRAAAKTIRVSPSCVQEVLEEAFGWAEVVS